MKVVIDTNVLVSGLLTPDGNPAKIIYLLLNERIEILYDYRIIEEYEKVLSRKKFRFERDDFEPLIEFIEQDGSFIVSDPIIDEFKDEDDKKFLEVARSGRAEYLITGNKAHFPVEECIVTPKEFVEIVEKR